MQPMQTVKILELVLIGLLGAVMLHSVRAEGQTVERDISEFVAAQGIVGLENDAVRQFVPPLRLISLLTMEGARCRVAAIARVELPIAMPRDISSRSA